jgi:kinesin family member 5
MAYGQTASGKTFTMQGKTKSDNEIRGIIPRMVETVFDHIASSPPHVEFLVKISIIEIYMEELRDLLVYKPGAKLKIRSGSSKGIFVENLTEVYVTSPEEVYRYIKIGNKNRSVGRTNMNVVSSRSHLMVNLVLH